MKDFIFCDSIAESIERIKEDSLTIPALESCGFLGYSPKNKAIVVGICENKCDKPDESFLISPYDHLDFISKNKIIAIYHSHAGESTPSDYDRLGCKNTCLPYLIYGMKDDSFSLIMPKILDKSSIYSKGIKNLKEILVNDY